MCMSSVVCVVCAAGVQHTNPVTLGAYTCLFLCAYICFSQSRSLHIPDSLFRGKPPIFVVVSGFVCFVLESFLFLENPYWLNSEIRAEVKRPSPWMMILRLF